MLFEKIWGLFFSESVQIFFKCEFSFQNISGKNNQGYMRL